jgi:hypothetical protein
MIVNVVFTLCFQTIIREEKTQATWYRGKVLAYCTEGIKFKTS